MRILRRYVLRSHVAPFFFALSALTLLMLLNELSKRFGMLMGKGLDPMLIVEVFALSVPWILAMTLPMAVLAAVLFAFNRMAGDNEIVAMKASGVHLPRLVAPVAAGGVLLALGMVWFNNDVLPETNHRLAVLLQSISQKKPTFVLRDQTVNEVLEGELYLQAAHVNQETSRLSDVVVYDERQPDRSRTIYADSGTMYLSDDRTDLHLVLYDGTTQERKENDPSSFQRIRFATMAMRVPDVTNKLQRQDLGGYRGEREMAIPQMRREVRSSDRRAGATALESRWTALYLTRRLLGMELRQPGDTATLAAAERELPDTAEVAVPVPGEAGRRDSSARRRRSARRDEATAAAADTAAPGADTATAPAAAAGSLAADSVDADSVAAAVRGVALEAVKRVSSPRTPPAKFESLAREHRASVSRANRYEVEIQKKFSIPAACIVFVLIGAPLAVRYRQAGMAMVVAASFLIFCAYYVSLVGGEKLSEELILTPFWAMWAPNVIFGLAGAALLWRSMRVG